MKSEERTCEDASDRTLDTVCDDDEVAENVPRAIGVREAAGESTSLPGCVSLSLPTEGKSSLMDGWPKEFRGAEANDRALNIFVTECTGNDIDDSGCD